MESDSDDDIKPNRSSANNSKTTEAKDSSKSKKRRVIYSSDEDEPKPKSKDTSSTLASKAAKLKTVNVNTAFGSAPVKRIEKEKKPKKNTSIDVFDADTDDMELMQIDEELLAPKSMTHESNQNEHKVKKVEKHTPKKEKDVLKAKNKKSPEKIKKEKKTPEKVKIEKKTPVKQEKQTPDDSEKIADQDRSNTKKKPPKKTPSSSKKPKEDESDLDRSVYDPDQEKQEKRRAAAVLYHQFQKRSGPSKPGSKEIPKGKPNCLSGLAFVLTGVFESMERDEAKAVIMDFGGRVTTAMSGKTNYVVAGEESGPAKLAKAEDLNIPILNEDDLLDLIRSKSGLPSLKPNSTVSDDKKCTDTSNKHSKKPPAEKHSPKREKRAHSSTDRNESKMDIDSEGNFNVLFFFGNIQF